MTKFKPLPTQQELHELFDYSVTTGELFYKTQVNNTVKIGQSGGFLTCNNKYRAVDINKHEYRISRIIWMWVTGEDPEEKIVDHKNGDKLCNAWHNLRIATDEQNAWNRRGTKGYSYNKNNKKYQARIRVKGKFISLGYFWEEAEAAAAYKKASLELHGAFSPYSDE